MPRRRIFEETKDMTKDMHEMYRAMSALFLIFLIILELYFGFVWDSWNP